MHVGHRRAGWAGLVVAGLAFIVPASIIVLALAWAYVEAGSLPGTGRVLEAVGAVVVAVVLSAAAGLGRTALRDPVAWLVAGAALVAALLGVPEIAVLAGGGLVVLAAREGVGAGGRGLLALPVALGVPGSVAVVAVVALPELFLAFAKIGALLVGSGYVLVSFLRTDLVTGLGWLTERQLIDAVAVGQVTPGPLSTTATFIGYLLLGVPGAAVATAAFFLPAFGFVALSVPVLGRISRSARARATLDGVNAAVIGLLVAVVVGLAGRTITDPLGLAIAALATALLVTRRAGPAVLVLGAAGLGIARLALAG